MANRSRDYYRKVRAKAIVRKRRISQGYWHVKAPGVLSKGKIHCSCWMCSSKTWRDGAPVSELRKYNQGRLKRLTNRRPFYEEEAS